MLERSEMRLPRGDRERVFVRGVAAPERLYEDGGGTLAPDQVLLALLLLHLEGEP